MACFMNGKGDCGAFRGVDGSNIVPIWECEDNIDAHLRRIHLSNAKIFEKHLILFRAGQFDVSDAEMKSIFVCPKHRGSLGKYWSNAKTACQYPEHKSKHQAVKGNRVFNVEIFKEVLQIFGMLIPLGSREYTGLYIS